MGFLAPPAVEHLNPYLTSGWDDGWRSALAACTTTPVRLLAIGDSITQGQYATAAGSAPAGYDYRTDGWLHKLVALVLAKYAAQGLVDGAEWSGPYGDSKIAVPNYVTANYVGGGTTGARPWVMPGTPGEVAGGAYAARVSDANGWWRQIRSTVTGNWVTNADAVLQFNAPVGTVRCDVITTPGVVAASGATWKYNWGGPVGTGDVTVTETYTTVGDGRAGDRGEPKLTTVYSGAASQGPLYLGNQSAAQSLALAGVIAYKNLTAGLQYGRLAYGGRTLGEFSQTAASLWPNNKVDGLFSPTDGYTAFPRLAHLVILALGTNDNNRNVVGLSYGPAGYRAALERAIMAIRKANPQAAVLILLPWHSSDFDDLGNQVNNSSWGAFQQAGYDLARRWDCAFVDMTPLWNPTPVGSGYIAGDAHPTRTGYTNIANTLAGLL